MTIVIIMRVIVGVFHIIPYNKQNYKKNECSGKVLHAINGVILYI